MKTYEIVIDGLTSLCIQIRKIKKNCGIYVWSNSLPDRLIFEKYLQNKTIWEMVQWNTEI
jgi:hypothetical protein